MAKGTRSEAAKSILDADFEPDEPVNDEPDLEGMRSKVDPLITDDGGGSASAKAAYNGIKKLSK